MEEIHITKRVLILAAAIVTLILIVAVVIWVFASGKSTEAAPSEPAEIIETTAATENTTSATESTSAPEVDIPSPTASVPTTEENIQTETPQPPSEAPSAPERGDYPIDAPTNDRERLACVIYQEAGGDAICDNCRKYVGDIVLNRVNDPRFPNTIEGVLLQSGQYGKFSWTGIVWQSRAHNASEKAAVERAYRVADELLAGNHSSLYGNGYVWQAGFVQGSDGFWCCGHFFGR